MEVGFITLEVGDGTRIRFWGDVWYDDTPLKESFHELFRIARNKEALVASYMHFSNEPGHWAFNLTRMVPDCEQESILTFLELI